jgi:hypothetical protein
MTGVFVLECWGTEGNIAEEEKARRNGNLEIGDVLEH